MLIIKKLESIPNNNMLYPDKEENTKNTHNGWKKY
jgi:hypothetical protein